MKSLDILYILSVSIIIMFIFREVVTWYWKINEVVRLLKEQNSLLRSFIFDLSSKRNNPEFDPGWNVSDKK